MWCLQQVAHQNGHGIPGSAANKLTKIKEIIYFQKVENKCKRCKTMSKWEKTVPKSAKGAKQNAKKGHCISVSGFPANLQNIVTPKWYELGN